MRNHIVNQVEGHLNEPPVEAHYSTGIATAPQTGGMG
jgi:hypothetical protein